MKIEANDKEIQDIFSQGYFKIPRFQRPYSWEVDEVESFWSDVVLENTENYFIGSMVVYQTKKPYFGIVDGQQRLTTITLILSAIRNAFIMIGEENLAKGVHKYIETPNIDNENEFILKTETSFPYLQDYIQSFAGFGIDCDVGSEEKKLEAAFNLIVSKIHQRIPKLKEAVEKHKELYVRDNNDVVQLLKDIRDKVISLKLVFIQLDNEDDAYLIFETLNARGRDLTTADLVKNLILKRIKSTSASIDQAKESWLSIVRNFDDVSDSAAVDNFLLHYWVSEFKYTTEKKLFSEVKQHIQNSPNEVRRLVENLNSVSPLYMKIISPNVAVWTPEEYEVRNSLKALKVFKVKQHSAMTLALLRAYQESRITLRVLKKTLAKIENFHYCFNAISSKRTGGVIASNYSKYAIMLTAANGNDQIQPILRQLETFLEGKLPDKDEFSIKFKDLFYASKRTAQKGLVRYSLSKLIPENSGCLPVDFESLTIEHLVPECENKDESFPEVASIGNLVLLDGKVNSEELADKDAFEKFNILNSNGFPVNSTFIDEGVWDAEFISLRAKKIGDVIYDSVRRSFS